MTLTTIQRQVTPILFAVALCVAPWGRADASSKNADLPDAVLPALHYLLDLAKHDGGTDFDAAHIEPFITFMTSTKAAGTIYSAGGGFGAPSAYNEFSVDTDLQRIVSYAINVDIPACTLWPSSLRMTRWTKVHGGAQQLARLRAASAQLDAPFIVQGSERVTITPDQTTGGYYSYDVDKTIIYSPYRKGKLLISVYRQQGPSEVGKKGLVLGSDDDWSYLYTNKDGLNLTGLGWIKSYMYDSFSVCVYYQADPDLPLVKYGSVSWVKAGWSGMNMVKPKHIYQGLLRVADAFKSVIEDPNLPDAVILAKTFSASRDLPTPTLKRYAGNYFEGLQARIAASESLREKVDQDFDSRAMLEQMTRDELYAVLALDYLKKLLGRDAVLKSHPFDADSSGTRQIGSL